MTTLISVLASSSVSLIKSAWVWHRAVWLWQVGLKFPLLPRWNNATLWGRIFMMRCKWHMDVLKEAVEAGCTTNCSETAAGEITGPSASAERKYRPVDVNWMEEWARVSLGTGERRHIYHLYRKQSWCWMIEAEYELKSHFYAWQEGYVGNVSSMQAMQAVNYSKQLHGCLFINEPDSKLQDSHIKEGRLADLAWVCGIVKNWLGCWVGSKQRTVIGPQGKTTLAHYSECWYMFISSY